MNKFGKSMIKALLLGGTVITVVALNSSNSMAAELDTIEPETQVEDVMDDSEQTEREKVIQSIEDAVEVIEGDAVVAEDCLNQGLEAIEYNDLPYDKGQEIMNAGGAVVGQAYEKWDYIQYTREDIITETEPEAEAAKGEFVDAAKEQGVEESVNRLENAETNQEKLNIVNETAEQAEKKYYEESDKNYKERRDTAIEINTSEDELAELKKELETIKDELAELEEKKIETSKDLYRFETNILEPYRKKIADIERRLEEAYQERERIIENSRQKEKEYNQLRGELNGILNELDDANWSLNNFMAEHDAANLDYDRSEYERLINRLNSACQHYTERSEALKNLPQAANDYINAEDRIFGFEDVIYGIQNELDWVQEDYNENGGDEAHEYLTRRAIEANENYDKVEAKVNELQNGVDKKQSYINSLKEKESTIIEKMQYQEKQYSLFCDATDKYRAILEELVYIDELYNRGYTAFSKTNNDFMTLINSVTEYWQSEQETDGAAVIEKMDKIEKELANDTAEIAKNANVIKGAQEDKTTTILAVNNERTAAETKYEVAKNNNQKIHKYYDQLKKALDKAGEEYRKLLEDLDDTYDEEAFAAAQEKYMTLIKLMKQAKDLLNQSDKDLEQATNNYNEVVVAYDDFNKDVTYITDAREFWDSGYRIVTFFEGYVKGNSAAVNESSSFQDILNNIWGYVGTFEGTVYDIYGNIVDRFKQDLNVRLV